MSTKPGHLACTDKEDGVVHGKTLQEGLAKRLFPAEVLKEAKRGLDDKPKKITRKDPPPR